MSERKAQKARKNSLLGANRDLGKKVGDLIRAGHGLKGACALVGIPRGQYSRWLDAEEPTSGEVEFAAEIATARAEVAAKSSAIVELARQRIVDVLLDEDNPESARTARWALERADPDFKDRESTPTRADESTLDRATLLQELAHLTKENGSA